DLQFFWGWRLVPTREGTQCRMFLEGDAGTYWRAGGCAGLLMCRYVPRRRLATSLRPFPLGFGDLRALRPCGPIQSIFAHRRGTLPETSGYSGTSPKTNIY